MLYKDLGGGTGCSTATARIAAPTSPTAWSRSGASAAPVRLADERDRRLPRAALEDPVNPRSRAEHCAGSGEGMRRAAVAYRGPQPVPGPPVWEPFTWTNGSARSSSPTCPAIGSSARRTPATRCTSRGCTKTGACGSRANPPLWAQTSQAQVRGVRLRLHLQARARQFRRAQSALDGRAHRAVAERFYLGNHFEWRVPVDDENTLSVAWFFMRVPRGHEPYVQGKVPTWHSPIKDENGHWIGHASTRTSSPGSGRAPSPTAPRRISAPRTSASR